MKYSQTDKLITVNKASILLKSPLPPQTPIYLAKGAYLLAPANILLRQDPRNPTRLLYQLTMLQTNITTTPNITGTLSPRIYTAPITKLHLPDLPLAQPLKPYIPEHPPTLPLTLRNCNLSIYPKLNLYTPKPIRQLTPPPSSLYDSTAEYSIQRNHQYVDVYTVRSTRKNNLPLAWQVKYRDSRSADTRQRTPNHNKERTFYTLNETLKYINILYEFTRTHKTMNFLAPKPQKNTNSKHVILL